MKIPLPQNYRQRLLEDDREWNAAVYWAKLALMDWRIGLAREWTAMLADVLEQRGENTSPHQWEAVNLLRTNIRLFYRNLILFCLAVGAIGIGLAIAIVSSLTQGVG